MEAHGGAIPHGSDYLQMLPSCMPSDVCHLIKSPVVFMDTPESVFFVGGWGGGAYAHQGRASCLCPIWQGRSSQPGSMPQAPKPGVILEGRTKRCPSATAQAFYIALTRLEPNGKHVGTTGATNLRFSSLFVFALELSW